MCIGALDGKPDDQSMPYLGHKDAADRLASLFIDKWYEGGLTTKRLTHRHTQRNTYIGTITLEIHRRHKQIRHI